MIHSCMLGLSVLLQCARISMVIDCGLYCYHAIYIVRIGSAIIFLVGSFVCRPSHVFQHI